MKVFKSLAAAALALAVSGAANAETLLYDEGIDGDAAPLRQGSPVVDLVAGRNVISASALYVDRQADLDAFELRLGAGLEIENLSVSFSSFYYGGDYYHEINGQPYGNPALMYVSFGAYYAKSGGGGRSYLGSVYHSIDDPVEDGESISLGYSSFWAAGSEEARNGMEFLVYLQGYRAEVGLQGVIYDMDYSFVFDVADLNAPPLEQNLPRNPLPSSLLLMLGAMGAVGGYRRITTRN